MHPMRKMKCHNGSLGGGAKGTTIDSKVAKGEALIDAKNWCVMEYDRAKRHHLTIKKRSEQKKGC
jgi:hypothetical protein